MNFERPAFLPSLTGMRCYLAVMVVISHLYVQIWGVSSTYPFMSDVILHAGKAGVSAFFVLSGFVIFWNYPPQKLTGRVFYWHRLARIYPAYVFCLFLSIPLEVLSPTTRSEYWAPSFLANLFMVANFSEVSLGRFNSVGWTLSVEAFFYLLYPIIFVRLALAGKKSIVTAVLVLAIIPIALKILFPGELISSYMFPMNRMFEFVLGIWTAMLIADFSAETVSFLKTKLLFLTVLLILATPVFSRIAGISLHYLITGPLCACMIFLAARGDLLGKKWIILSSGFVIWMGEISYALYLIHELLFRYTKGIFIAIFGMPPSDSDTWIKIILITSLSLISFASAAAIYRIVETPGRKLIRRLSST